MANTRPHENPEREEPLPPSRNAKIERISAEIERTQDDLKRLRETVSTRTTGFWPTVKNLGAFVGVIGGILGCVSWILTTRLSLFPKPDTNVTRGDDLRLAYDPTKRVLRIGFDFDLTNFGNRADLIKPSSARLAPQLDAQSSDWESIPFNSSNFICTSYGSPVPKPFPVGIGSAIPISCSLSSYIGLRSLKAIEQPGARRLTVTLKGSQGRAYVFSFCFPLTDMIVDELLRGKGKQEKKYLNTQCP